MINKLFKTFLVISLVFLSPSNGNASTGEQQIEKVTVPVLTTRLKAGSVITDADIVMKEFPAPRIRPNIIVEAEDLIGKSPKRSIAANIPIRIDSVKGASVVTKGSIVDIFYKTGSVEIKTIGEALNDAAEGELVRVKNLKSETIVQGVAEAKGVVNVSPRSRVLASR